MTNQQKHQMILKAEGRSIAQRAVNEEWLRDNAPDLSGSANLAVVTAPFMDSMPSIGNPILVDTSITTCDHDGLYFFRVGNEAFIKWLRREPGRGIIAVSENKEYSAFEITEDMDFQVLGKVVNRGRNDG